MAKYLYNEYSFVESTSGGDMRRLIYLLICGMLFLGASLPVRAQSDSAVIRLVDRNGANTSRLIDGNRIQLSVKLSAPVQSASQADFVLEGLASPVASCSLAAGAVECTSESFAALGWFWSEGGVPAPGRVVRVNLNGQAVLGALEITIKPRPVVMVHGFISTWETWQAYLGPSGYLASIGLNGFAVGDGQVPGILNTGNPSDPAGRTNSIAQNAEILNAYIEGVQQKTGAEKVDLLVHSMGGMITRYYLDRVMQTENVAQVIFLGTPMAGSACVYPVAALGYLMPASLEILPDYMINIFNSQIVHRHGVPFYMLAGTLLIDPLTSPCASAPSDTVVGFDSATAVQLDEIHEFPLYHGDLTSNKQVFEQEVMHLLQNLPESFFARPDLAAPAVAALPGQFSRVYAGHLEPGQSALVTINIDPNVSLASFNLYDSSRSLDVEVRGASGKVITLDPVQNGLVKISDPQIMFYLGYGFKQPKPGKWVVKLFTTAQTPGQGADYSIAARFDGGASLNASSSPTIPALGQTVTLRASLQLGTDNLQVDSAEAVVRKPDGSQVSLPMKSSADGFSADYKADQAGLHSVEVRLSGSTADGFGVDRAAFLAFEVQPGSAQIDQIRTLALFALLFLVVLALLFIWLRIRRGKTS